MTLSVYVHHAYEREKRVGSAIRNALSHAFRAGMLLKEAKDKVEHGDWLDWLQKNCPDNT